MDTLLHSTDLLKCYRWQNYTTVSNADLYLSYFDPSYVFPGHNDSVQWGLTVFMTKNDPLITDCKTSAMFDLSVRTLSSHTLGFTSPWWTQWTNSKQHISMLFAWTTKYLWYGQNATWNLEKLCFYHDVKWTYLYGSYE